MNHSTDSWDAYVPSKSAPWNLARVVHLHRSVGFAATWDEIQRDLKEGPGPAVERLVEGKARSQGVPSGFAEHSARLARLAVATGDLGRLKAWWVYRMLLGPDPLGERLTLFWHNYFATSAAKVKMAVFRQNEVFREFGRGPFGDLLSRVVKDPALLTYLDAPVNRKGKPNENLARELMELFTLGVGHYTEKDVQEAARTLTGWGVAGGAFRNRPEEHDEGIKTILGRSGRWKGDDLLAMLLAHPATARHLAARLCESFLGEGAVDAAAVGSLADELRRRKLDMGPAVKTLLRSRAFFADANLGTRILGPVEFLVGAARALELFDPPPSTLVLAEFAGRAGQDLFHPPNVGGWPGGRSWITARGAVARSNGIAALLEGLPAGRQAAFDAEALARKHGRGRDLESAVAFFGELLVGRAPAPAWRERLLAGPGSKRLSRAQVLRRAIHRILSSPQAQLV